MTERAASRREDPQVAVAKINRSSAIAGAVITGVVTLAVGVLTAIVTYNVGVQHGSAAAAAPVIIATPSRHVCCELRPILLNSAGDGTG